MSRERLEEIKSTKWENLRTSQIIHVKWLIEQAKKNKRYREALEFYADRDNYKEFYDVMRERKVMMIIEDGGKKACEALEGESNE